MNLRRFLLLACATALASVTRAADSNPFFAMNTIAKGPPEIVVPLLKDLGYAGLGGASGDRAMAEALAQSGLRFFNGYLTTTLRTSEPGVPADVAERIKAMQGLDTTLWLAISGLRIPADLHREQPEDPKWANAVAARLKELADFAQQHGVKVSLYPHTGHHFEHFEDALQMVNRVNHPALGVTFNLCHWLKVEGSERDPAPLLKAALPRLTFVTINGADTGDTRTMAWNRLILPLGEGTYDVAAFLKKLHALGYTGPIGFQGYGIKGEPREVLTRTMAAWKQLQPAAAR